MQTSFQFIPPVISVLCVSETACHMRNYSDFTQTHLSFFRGGVPGAFESDAQRAQSIMEEVLEQLPLPQPLVLCGWARACKSVNVKSYVKCVCHFERLCRAAKHCFELEMN